MGKRLSLSAYTIRLHKQHNYFLNYYEDSNFYDYHTDKATITALTIFFQEPKKFEGGELLFENELTIPCENNTLVIFPSILKHRAETIKMKTKEKL